MGFTVAYLIYSGVMPLIKTYIVVLLLLTWSDSLSQVCRAPLRLCACEDGHVPARGITRRLHCSHERRLACAHLRKHCTVLQPLKRCGFGSDAPPCMRLPDSRFPHGNHHPRVRLRAAQLLARHRHTYWDEQLGKPALVTVSRFWICLLELTPPNSERHRHVRRSTASL